MLQFVSISLCLSTVALFSLDSLLLCSCRHQQELSFAFSSYSWRNPVSLEVTQFSPSHPSCHLLDSPQDSSICPVLQLPEHSTPGVISSARERRRITFLELLAPRLHRQPNVQLERLRKCQDIFHRYFGLFFFLPLFLTMTCLLFCLINTETGLSGDWNRFF